RSLMYSLAAKVQTNSEKKTTKLYFHTQGFAGDPLSTGDFVEQERANNSRHTYRDKVTYLCFDLILFHIFV
ncbi:hypothetical protein, partial [uncultured Prevotella sp.]|uniref:hypothetical protein n=1 Tax=uncultured Prevotella sp. TaxID=159272 RepID=UPI00258FE2CE